MLTSQQIKDDVAASITDSSPDNDGAACAFDGLEVRSVTDAGAYQTRMQYRALVTGVDAKSAGANNVTYTPEDSSANAATYTVDANATASGNASYTVTVSTEAGLAAEGSDATAAKDAQPGMSDTQGADASASQASGQETPLVSLLNTLAQSIGLTAAQPTPTVVQNEDGSTTYTYTIHNDMQNYAGDGTVSFALGNLAASTSADKPDVSFTLESKGAPGTDGWGTSIYGYDADAFSVCGYGCQQDVEFVGLRVGLQLRQTALHEGLR